MGGVHTIIKIAVLALLGMCAAFSALWLESNRYAIPHWGYVAAALMGCFFVLMTWALFLLLALRDRRNAFLAQTQAMQSQAAYPLPNTATGEELTVYTLQPGRCYEVRQAFRDYYGNDFAMGERLTFQQRHFLPYDGGHTVMFAEKTMYLQEDVNSAILDEFCRYLGACDC
jgi:hypothetical protein